MPKQNTIKEIANKIVNNGDENDYKYIPIGANAENIDRKNGETVEESLLKLENIKLKYEDPFLILVDKDQRELSRVTIVSARHEHNYTEKITKQATYLEKGLKTYMCACGDSYTEEIPKLTDNINPIGTITVCNNTYSSLNNNVSFSITSDTSQEVVIEASDSESGIKGIWYYLSSSILNESDFSSVSWIKYENSFVIEPDCEYIVYAKIVDNQDNVTYINTDGIILNSGVYEEFEITQNNLEMVGIDCTNKEELLIPEKFVYDGKKYKITSIGDFSFFTDTYSSMTSVTIPDSVTSIGSNAFNNCTNLTTITIPDSVTSIGSNAFNNCRSLTSITIPSGVLSINSSLFSSCESLTSITIPNGVTSIGSNAFQYCTNLTTVTIPNGVTKIENSVFKYCTNLKSVTLSDNLESIGTYSFQYCKSLTSVTIPNGVYDIGVSAFYGCTNLMSVTIPNSVIIINGNAFSGCTNLTTVTIPDGVDYIGTNAFKDVPHIYYNGTTIGSPWGAKAIN